jgi:hypothetical protein
MDAMFSLTTHSSTLSTLRPYVAATTMLAANLRSKGEQEGLKRDSSNGTLPFKVTVEILRVAQKLLEQYFGL